MSSRQLFEELARRCKASTEIAEKLKSVEAVAQLEIKNEDESVELFQLRFEKSHLEAKVGQAEDASFGLLMHALDFEDLLRGRAKLRACLVDGRLEIEGDLGKAMQLVEAIFAAGEHP